MTLSWIPTPSDKIYVRYQLPDHSLVWWPAILQEVTVRNGMVREAKASVLLLFENRYDYPAEELWMDMIDDETILTKIPFMAMNNWTLQPVAMKKLFSR